ncbi:MAG: Ig-like domain-containing protein [Alcanivorax sp.]
MTYLYTKEYIKSATGMDLKEFIHTAEERGLVFGEDFLVINGKGAMGIALENAIFELSDDKNEEKEIKEHENISQNIEPAAGEEDADQGESIIDQLFDLNVLDFANSAADNTTSHSHSSTSNISSTQAIARVYDRPVLDTESLSQKLGSITMSDTQINQTELSYDTQTVTFDDSLDAVAPLIAEEPQNIAPEAIGDFFFTNINTSISGNVLTDNGYGADIDPDGGAVSALAGTYATEFGGSVTIDTDGSYSYTPATGYSGTDSFSYTITDNDGAIDTANVLINVTSGHVSTQIDFSTATITHYGVSQNKSDNFFIEDNGNTLHMENNTWKDITLNYTVTSNTVIEFDFMSTSQGEIHGIGFDTNDGIDSNLTFKLYGTQGWGIGTYNNYAGNEGEWVHYTIDVGARYTGNFTRLFFVNDDDQYVGANGSFSNIIIHEGGSEASETMTGTTGSQTLMGLGGDDVIYGMDGDDVLYGGSGIDFLYGGDGADTFGFDDINDTDHVQDFSITDGDMLDISDLLEGYDPLTDAIVDFVAVTSDGHDTIISVDTDGGADNYVQIAIMHGVSGLSDVETLENDGTLITV